MLHRPPVRHLVRTSLAAVLAASLATTSLAQPVAAYSGGNAATWAEAHYNSCSYTFPCLPNDCTNFVSEALHAGGAYPEDMDPLNNEANRNYWWATRTGLGEYIASDTWAYANDLKYYLLNDNPGGSGFTTKSGTSLASDTGLVRGDVLFYDWDNNGRWDHASMLTKKDWIDDNWSKVQTGDTISQHSTTNRKRAWWTLYPYNTYRNTTKILLVHISPNN